MSTDAKLHELNSDGRPDVAVVECPEDEALWWSLVLIDALERDYEYGLDEAADSAGLMRGSYYYEPAVADWLREHVEPPAWRWYRWEPIPEEDQDFYESSAWLQGSKEAERPGPDWWRGAIVTVRSTP